MAILTGAFFFALNLVEDHFRAEASGKISAALAQIYVIKKLFLALSVIFVTVLGMLAPDWLKTSSAFQSVADMLESFAKGKKDSKAISS